LFAFTTVLNNEPRQMNQWSTSCYHSQIYSRIHTACYKTGTAD